uniref:Uncharacterized protein n=1 Tax=Candidatus Kentrum sp. LPFa TaxID=2126335 RepID=A0A450VYP9_9GAMM|nr:MAG: hypothetical protein BECKLPF1236A_GA0070988_1002910 [Candidatus Kentron sp. LPFa]VFK26169.1 MAG: hypothetical protein BECKLPF1236C_GA0070990_1003110 [Candidatus Kentron sp. LPFa]
MKDIPHVGWIVAHIHHLHLSVGARSDPPYKIGNIIQGWKRKRIPRMGKRIPRILLAKVLCAITRVYAVRFHWVGFQHGAKYQWRG